MKTFKEFCEQAAPDSKFYRNFYNDMIPNSGGPTNQIPLMAPSIKQDALKYWMNIRGFPQFPQAKAKSKTKTV